MIKKTICKLFDIPKSLSNEEQNKISSFCKKAGMIKSKKIYKTYCPFHESKKQTFFISQIIGEYICFDCLKKGKFNNLKDDLAKTAVRITSFIGLMRE